MENYQTFTNRKNNISYAELRCFVRNKCLKRFPNNPKFDKKRFGRMFNSIYNKIVNKIYFEPKKRLIKKSSL